MTRAAVAAAILAGFAWVTTGVVPFSTTSYVLVAIPSVAIILTYVGLGGLSPRRDVVSVHYRRQSHDASLSSVSPWIAVLLVAVVLEVIGLSLGGRSTSVPTLSTTVDHLLRFHWSRFLICFAWLTVGVTPLVGLHRSSQSGDPR
jgi:hypothetical protein